MSVPLRPGINPRRFADALWMPRPNRLLLSADSALWREEHGVALNSKSAPARANAISPTPSERVAQRV